MPIRTDNQGYWIWRQKIQYNLLPSKSYHGFKSEYIFIEVALQISFAEGTKQDRGLKIMTFLRSIASWFFMLLLYYPRNPTWNGQGWKPPPGEYALPTQAARHFSNRPRLLRFERSKSCRNPRPMTLGPKPTSPNDNGTNSRIQGPSVRGCWRSLIEALGVLNR